MADNNFRISSEELFSSQVEEYLETQAHLSRGLGEVEEQSWFFRLIYANWLYLAFWGMAGAFVGWLIMEPFINDNDQHEQGLALVAGLLLFPTIAGFIGLFLGAAEGLMCRNLGRAFISGIVGLAVGFIGGCVLIIPTGLAFHVAHVLATERIPTKFTEQGMPTGLALLVLMMGRALAWAIIAVPAGVGQGIAIREKKVIINGLLGAVMGGFIGGLLFDPIAMVLPMVDGQAVYSRCVGFLAIGTAVGLLIGVVEGWTKTAWLLMKKGPLAGKQFILYKDTTVLGSSPKAEVYLFKDDAIEPRHVIIHNRGGRFEIEDCNTPDGTYVNGVPVKRAYLNPGDQIVLGKTVLEFALREIKH